VGISINLQVVMTSPVLVDRAGESVVLLASVLLGATAVLIPGQHRDALAVELLVMGVLVLFVMTRTLRSTASSPVQGFPVLYRRVLSLGAPTLTMAAGVSLLANGGGGLNWWVAAVVVAYLGALVGGWVLLVEILR
ncbi:MAG: hypothetical protein ACXV9P_15425, partial [Acidimicrobiia bacterium]